MIQALFDSMKTEAVRQGLEFIEKEKMLNEAFANGSVNAGKLRSMLNEVSAALSDLRYVHLEAHLQTADILTPGQIETYNSLRGYNSITDPCENIPEGHDPAMWKMHNNCN